MSWVFNPKATTSNLTIAKNGSVVGTRAAINFIEGSQISETVSDNPGATRVDVTIASSATGGGGQLSGSLYSGTIASPAEGSIVGDTVAQGFSSSFAFAGTLTANQIYYVPVQVISPCTIYRMGWVNAATVAGNVDVGIYSESGTRLVSSGSTAMAGATADQDVDVTDTALAADTYYLAFVTNSATATFYRSTASRIICRAAGQKEQAGTFPLPATATFGAPTTSFSPYVFAVFQGATF